MEELISKLQDFTASIPNDAGVYALFIAGLGMIYSFFVKAVGEEFKKKLEVWIRENLLTAGLYIIPVLYFFLTQRWISTITVIAIFVCYLFRNKNFLKKIQKLLTAKVPKYFLQVVVVIHVFIYLISFEVDRRINIRETVQLNDTYYISFLMPLTPLTGSKYDDNIGENIFRSFWLSFQNMTKEIDAIKVYPDNYGDFVEYQNSFFSSTVPVKASRIIDYGKEQGYSIDVVMDGNYKLNPQIEDTLHSILLRVVPQKIDYGKSGTPRLTNIDILGELPVFKGSLTEIKWVGMKCVFALTEYLIRERIIQVTKEQEDLLWKNLLIDYQNFLSFQEQASEHHVEIKQLQGRVISLVKQTQSIERDSVRKVLTEYESQFSDDKIREIDPNKK